MLKDESERLLNSKGVKPFYDLQTQRFNTPCHQRMQDYLSALNPLIGLRIQSVQGHRAYVERITPQGIMVIKYSLLEKGRDIGSLSSSIFNRRFLENWYILAN